MTRSAALLGLAAGDVLGAGLEGFDRRRAAAGLSEQPEGPWTDDTQQALIVARHLLVHRSVDGVALAVELRSPDVAHRGIGPGFARFLATGLPQASAGNGAAMRSAPIGIRFGRPSVIDESIAAGLVTHADPRGVAAGVAVAAAVAVAADGTAGTEMLAEIADDVTDAEHRLFADHGLRFEPGDGWHTMSEAIRAAAGDVDRQPGDIATAVGARAGATSAVSGIDGTHPYAAASVVTALVVAAGAVDPVRALREAVSLGGDADTVGAIVGAVVGARFGVEEWPWPVPKRELLLEIGRRLTTREGAQGIPDTADLVR